MFLRWDTELSGFMRSVEKAREMAYTAYREVGGLCEVCGGEQSVEAEARGIQGVGFSDDIPIVSRLKLDHHHHWKYD